jgi:hypothetical protein
MKSSRHIFKLPLDIPIQKFDINNPNHQKLAKLGEKGQKIVKQNVTTLFENNKSNYSKFKIQNILNEKLKLILTQIDEILMKEFYPT